MKKLIMLLCVLWAHNSMAQVCKDPYCGFVSVGLGYTLDQPKKHLHVNDYEGVVTKTNIPLYYDTNLNYSLETGVKIRQDNTTLTLGLSWFDLLNQGASREFNRPYMLQPYITYQKNSKSNNWFVYVGAGYKLFSDDTIRKDGLKLPVDNNPILDKVTARMGIGYNLSDNTSLSLEHHSQWFKGWPINDNFEYHNTSLVIRYNY